MDINELREEVLRRQKAATAKVSRLRRKGVQLTGSEFDVRREPSRVGRYNTRQLKSYLNELNEFTSRRNAFVAGSEGAPIQAHVWKHAERRRAEYNEFVKNRYSQIQDTYIPKAGMTVRDFEKDVKSTRRKRGHGVTNPFGFQPARPSTDFTSSEAVRIAAEAMNAKLKPSFIDASNNKAYRQLRAAVEVFGDDELTKQAMSLSPDQIDTLWNYTDAPRDAFSAYHFMQLFSNNLADETAENILEDSSYEVREWIDWAKSLPARRNR